MVEKVKTKGLLYKINDHGISNKGVSVCPTLTANMGTYPDRVHILRDDYGIRKLTPYECLKLQGFPDSYTFLKGMDINQAYKQVGNSVCVPLIERIAKQIMEVFN